MSNEMAFSEPPPEVGEIRLAQANLDDQKRVETRALQSARRWTVVNGVWVVAIGSCTVVEVGASGLAFAALAGAFVLPISLRAWLRLDRAGADRIRCEGACGRGSPPTT